MDAAGVLDTSADPPVHIPEVLAEQFSNLMATQYRFTTNSHPEGAYQPEQMALPEVHIGTF